MPTTSADTRPDRHVPPGTLVAALHGGAAVMTSRSWFSRAYGALAQWVDHRVGWDKLPKPLGLLVLVGLRDTLRAKNLYDTGVAPTTDSPRCRPSRRPTSSPAPPTAPTTTSATRAWAWPAPASAATSRPPMPSPTRHGPDDARPTPDQPRPVGPSRLRPRHDAEHAGRHLDPVHGQGLVQPRQGTPPNRAAVRSSRTTTGPNPSCSSRPRCPTRPEPRAATSRPPSSIATPPGGTARRSTATPAAAAEEHPHRRRAAS